MLFAPPTLVTLGRALRAVAIAPLSLAASPLDVIGPVVEVCVPLLKLIVHAAPGTAAKINVSMVVAPPSGTVVAGSSTMKLLLGVGKAPGLVFSRIGRA